MPGYPLVVRTLPRLLVILGLAVAANALFVACDEAESPPKANALLPTRALEVEGNGKSAELTVEIAATTVSRQQGLMFRQEMGDDEGMLFLFVVDRQTGFWMSNTYLPLTMAYIAADGTILELLDGTPLDLTPQQPKQPYRYVLEVNQGWFGRNGLGIGSKVILPDDLPAPQA